MRFFEVAGKMAMGSRVRLLGDVIAADAAKIYRAYGTRLQPKWFPVFFALSESDGNTVTAIADFIGHSHASVSKIIAEMSKAGLTVDKTDGRDRRRRLIVLSRMGKDIARKIVDQYEDVAAAIAGVEAQASHNLWEALAEWEYLLAQRSLSDRVQAQKKRRESRDVKIVPFRPKYRDAFRRLNEQWIKTHFKMEQPDHDALDHPKTYILDRGGFIFVALFEGKPVGVCALVKRDDLRGYELAKMAVAPEKRGLNIGYLLGQAVVAKARTLEAKLVFLESNTVLTPAIKLYEKLGFQKVSGAPTSYERCNIQMELRL